MTVDPKRRVVLQATLAVSALSLSGLPLQSRGATALRFARDGYRVVVAEIEALYS